MPQELVEEMVPVQMECGVEHLQYVKVQPNTSQIRSGSKFILEVRPWAWAGDTVFQMHMM